MTKTARELCTSKGLAMMNCAYTQIGSGPSEVTNTSEWVFAFVQGCRIGLGAFSFTHDPFVPFHRLKRKSGQIIYHIWVIFVFPGVPTTLSAGSYLPTPRSVVLGELLWLSMQSDKDTGSVASVDSPARKNVLVGVTGSVAAVKVPKLVQQLLSLEPKVNMSSRGSTYILAHAPFIFLKKSVIHRFINCRSGQGRGCCYAALWTLLP